MRINSCVRFFFCPFTWCYTYMMRFMNTLFCFTLLRTDCFYFFYEEHYVKDWIVYDHFHTNLETERKQWSWWRLAKHSALYSFWRKLLFMFSRSATFICGSGRQGSESYVFKCLRGEAGFHGAPICHGPLCGLRWITRCSRGPLHALLTIRTRGML